MHPPAPGVREPTPLRPAWPGELDDQAFEGTEALYRHEGPPRLTIRRDERRGVRLDHDYFGTFLVAPGGREVVCDPRELPSWLWQRFMVGQVLPLAATLLGFEPLHAAAVAVDGTAIVCIGPSGAGKSSVALQLVDRGAALLADDVAAVSVKAGRPVVHPGPALISAGEEELAFLGPEGRIAGWERLGSLEGEARLAGPGLEMPYLPLAALFVLSREAGGPPAEIAVHPGPAAKALLGATFNAYVRDPARLARHLDVSSAVAGSVPVLALRSGPGGSSHASAAAIEAWAKGL